MSVMPATDDVGGRRKPSLLRTAKAVAWAFLGVRKGSEYREDIARLTPLHVIAVGIAGGLLFVLLLVGVAHWAARA